MECDKGKCDMYQDIKLKIRKFPVRFKRYSFLSKYSYCVRQSLASLRALINLDSSGKDPYTWEMASFAMLSMLMQELDVASELEEHEARKLVNFIRTNQWLVFDVPVERWIPQTMIAQQYQFQMRPQILAERYHYFFTYRHSEPEEDGTVFDVDEIIYKKVKVHGESLLDFFFLVLLSAVSNKPFDEMIPPIAAALKDGVRPPFYVLMKELSLTREEFQKVQQEFNDKSTYGYFLSRNMLEENPFVKIGDKTYLPAAPFALTAVTNRMILRITAHDEKVRKLLGKHTMEGYVLSILKQSNCYDVVHAERTYCVKGEQRLSPDAMIVKDGEALVIDCKLSQPPFALRCLKDDDAQKMASRYGEYVAQVYRRIADLPIYEPTFVGEREKIFGLVVVFEDSFVARSRVYDLAYRELGNLKETDREFIRSHIHVIGLYELERYCYSHIDLFEAVANWAKERPTDGDCLLPVPQVATQLTTPYFEGVLNENPTTLLNRLFKGEQGDGHHGDC